MTKKGVVFKWSEQQQKAFEAVKDMAQHPSVLFAPDETRNFVLVTDASEVAFGCILGQFPEQETEAEQARSDKKE